MGIVMYAVSDEYNSIAQELLELPEFDDIRPFASFVVLASSEAKKSNRRTVFGQCSLVSDLYKWCCPYDFIILIYEPNIDYFTHNQLKTLIRHELHHIGYDATKNEPEPYLVPHDVEEFNIIIKECGLHWEELSKGE